MTAAPGRVGHCCRLRDIFPSWQLQRQCTLIWQPRKFRPGSSLSAWVLDVVIFKQMGARWDAARRFFHLHMDLKPEEKAHFRGTLRENWHLGAIKQLVHIWASSRGAFIMGWKLPFP